MPEKQVIDWKRIALQILLSELFQDSLHPAYCGCL